MQQDVETVGADLAKNVFQVHATGADGRVLVRQQPIPAFRLIDAGFIRIGQWTSSSDEAFEFDCIVPADADVRAHANRP